MVDATNTQRETGYDIHEMMLVVKESRDQQKSQTFERPQKAAGVA
jgi:hypothetical protein